MLLSPGFIKIPTNNGPYGLSGSACNSYKKGKTSCKKNYTYQGKSGCVDTSYGGSCAVGLGVTVVGVVITIGGIAITVT